MSSPENGYRLKLLLPSLYVLFPTTFDSINFNLNIASNVGVKTSNSSQKLTLVNLVKILK